VRAPFSRLIYPLHDAAGLGTHLTLDLAGQGRFGPDTEWLPDGGPIDYTVDAKRGERFYAAIRRYWPGLPDGSLQPDYSGVRPKLSAEGVAARDFAIDGPAVHGVPGLVNLFGIESPGMTAALAIAERVRADLSPD
jgi:L-2-hydroxyglutarate oxidase LhgO